MAEDRRVAVVTGGTRGLGAAISRRLVREGVIVAAAYHQDDDAATRLVESIEAPGRCSTYRHDAADPASCRQLVADVLADH